MLTHEEIAELWRTESHPGIAPVFVMALALLDVAELVPGEGDIVERASVQLRRTETIREVLP